MLKMLHERKIFFILCSKLDWRYIRKMKDRTLKYNLMLVLAAFIWGSAFVAQSVGTDYVKAFTFQCGRSILASLVLLPVILLVDRKKTEQERKDEKNSRKDLWIGGILCGTCLGLSGVLQQHGISMTTVGKAGFLTAMYILIVPILGLFFRKKVSAKIWACVGIEVIGLYLLCMTEHFYLSKGDTFVALCAVTFSIHILLIDYYAAKVDPIKLSCVQFFVSFVLCGIFAVFFEKPTWGAIWGARIPLLYLGVLSGGIAFTLQIVAQKRTKPAVASLLMSLESVFSLVSGMIVLHEIPTLREGIGGFLMFGAIVLAQIPEKKKS